MKTIERNDYGHIIIKTRHSALVCKRTDAHDHSCKCAKQLFLNRKGHVIERVTAGTNDLLEARTKAKGILEGWTPAAQELAKRKALDEKQHTTITEAVGLYLTDFARRHKNANGETENEREGRNRTYFGYRHLLNAFMEWVDSYNSTHPEGQLQFVTDITAPSLMKWVNSWTWSDLTCHNYLVIARSFFKWMHESSFTATNPAARIRSPKKKVRGNRTAIFVREQYETIMRVVDTIEPPDRVARERKSNWSRRLHTFIELMRWTGMARIDAVKFDPSWIDADGVLTYRRQKTGVEATIPLTAIAPHMLPLLRNIPLDTDVVGRHQPFRTKGVMLDSDMRRWTHYLDLVFREAGITKVKNSVGRERAPHSHMFRDTFASHCLNDLDLELPDVAKMLGHANSKVTEEGYWPWVKERSTAMERRIRDARSLYLKRQRKNGKVVSINQEQILVAASGQ